MSTISNAIGHLREQFRKAQPIVLTGAGFSLGATNIAGETVLSAKVLKEKLWRLCFGDAPIEDSNLQDLFQTARGRHRKELIEIMNQGFTVNPDSIPKWYIDFFSLPWHRYYTLNVDDLALAAQRKAKLPRTLIPISGTTGKVKSVRKPGAAELDVVHLHGMLDDVPDNVTFSLSQYAQRQSREDIWYSTFASDLMSRPTVFLGTSVDEPPMWQHVVSRRQRGGRSEQELRPKSYLVTPSLSKAREACLAEFNIVWIPLTGEQFYNEVLRQVKDGAEAGLQLLADLRTQTVDFKDELKEVSELAIRPNEKSDFLLGQEPIWADVQSNRAVEREVDKKIWADLEPKLKSNAPRGYFLISGTAGGGKSTSLRRIALMLTAAGHRVAWVSRNHHLSPRAIKQWMTGHKPPTVLAIDDADLYGSELSSLTKELVTGGTNPLIVIALRSGLSDRILNQTQLKDIPRHEVIVPPLSDSDIDGLLAVLERENRLGVLAAKRPEERRAVLREKCGRQLLVAMIEATSGKPFEEKIVSELHELEAEQQKVYALLAIVTCWRTHLTKGEVLLAIGDTNNKVLNALERLVATHIIVRTAQQHYMARHKVIAEVVMRDLTNSGDLPDLLYGIVYAASSQIHPETPWDSREYLLTRRCINHEFLLKSISEVEARNFYGRIEDLLASDFNFWLQRGSLELESGNLGFAEHCLNTARTLNSSDLNTQTEYAYLLFRKAIGHPSGTNAEKYVHEADQLLTANIAIRGAKDPHSYHVLAENMRKWIERGIVSKEEKKAELQRIITIVRDGREKHPANVFLKQAESELMDDFYGLTLK